MNLRDYLAQDRHRAAGLAAALVVPVQMIYPWANGRRPCPPLRCVAIERATGGVVTRRELRPTDYAEHWPELAQQQPPAAAAALAGAAGQRVKVPRVSRRAVGVARPPAGAAPLREAGEPACSGAVHV